MLELISSGTFSAVCLVGSAGSTLTAAFLRPVGSIDVNPLAVLGCIAMVVVGIGAGRRMREFWRGGDYYERVLRALLIFGEVQGRAFTSAVPLASFASALFGVSALALFGRELAAGVVQDALAAVATVLLPVTLITFAVILAIVLVGRPRVLIPPALRDHRGIVGELIARVASSGTDRRQGE